MTTNVHGDDLDRAEGGFGVDIARQRMDALDLASLRAALELRATSDEPVFALDLGCGVGAQALRFASLGLSTVAIDLLPRERTVFAAPQLEAALPVRYLRRDARELGADDLPRTIHLAYSQRFIHHLRFEEAADVLRLLRARMSPGAPLYLSASGLGSELGEGYGGASEPLEARYAPLSLAARERHHIEGRVCLYAPDDLARLGSAAGFALERVELSAFGNVKGAFLAGP